MHPPERCVSERRPRRWRDGRFSLPALNPDAPVFKHEWERQVFGAAVSLTISLKSPWSLDELRFIREGMSPVDYLTAPYYGGWLYGIEKLVVKYGLASEEELRNPTVLSRD